jgi:hypothetical protein
MVHLEHDGFGGVYVSVLRLLLAFFDVLFALSARIDVTVFAVSLARSVVDEFASIRAVVSGESASDCEFVPMACG